MLHTILAQATSTEAGAGGTIYLLIWLVVVVIAIAGVWKTFEKAGQPGWAAIIPIYNVYIMLKVAERPGWWLLLMLIPFVNIVAQAIVSIDIAKRFGRSEVFGIFGLWLFSVIGYPMLGFGDDKYKPGEPSS